jgi:hypothetical protein
MPGGGAIIWAFLSLIFFRCISCQGLSRSGLWLEAGKIPFTISVHENEEECNTAGLKQIFLRTFLGYASRIQCDSQRWGIAKEYPSMPLWKGKQ